LLRQFEKGLDPRFPEYSEIPARVLGYGEISTVFEIGADAQTRLAYKRMPMFKTSEEVNSFEALYKKSIAVLQDQIGLRVVPSEIVRLVNEDGGRITVYIVQEKLPRETIANHAIHFLKPKEVRRLVLAILGEMKRVFDFNRDHEHELELGFDGQISNWAIAGFDPDKPRLGNEIELIYFDTSSPLLREHGTEQLNSELFLRSAPSFLVWIIRLLFLEEVMTRYYDFRNVAIDLVANFYKEQWPDLIPTLVECVNDFFAEERRDANFKPITVKEVRAYYREDALIWRLYLAFRKIVRSLHRLVGKEYPYILPEKIIR